jgi:hypothetical protein
MRHFRPCRTFQFIRCTEKNHVMRVAVRSFLDDSATRRSGGKRNFSSVDTPADAASIIDAAKLKLQAAEQKPSNVLFPWRHETSETLLPRLVFGTPEYLADVRLPNDIQGMLAVLFLKVPFWKVFFGTSWRDELAESCAFAFAQGTAGIISNVYKLPFSTVSDVDGNISFQFPVSEVTDANESKGDDEKVDEKPSDKTAPGEAENKVDDDDVFDASQTSPSHFPISSRIWTRPAHC